MAVNAALRCFLSVTLGKIPARHRTIRVAYPWLLLIPAFQLFWNFVIFPGISLSFQNCIGEVEGEAVGDCGEVAGTCFSVSLACWLVPLVNYVAIPVSLVLLIAILVRFHRLKTRLADRRQLQATSVGF